MDIRFITTEDASRIAALHVKGINTGFIISLGLDFVTALYESIAEEQDKMGKVNGLDFVIDTAVRLKDNAELLWLEKRSFGEK